MLILELLQNICLLLLVGRGQALLLLALVKHHLLNHAARLAVEVRQLRVFGLDLGHVNLGCSGHDVSPPFHLVDLVEVNFHRLGSVRVGRERPGRVVDENSMGEVALRMVSHQCRGLGGEVRTLMMGSWPLIPAVSLSFLISTTRSRDFTLSGTVKVTSSSPMVCVHLYGRLACSSSSLAREAASSAGDGSDILVSLYNSYEIRSCAFYAPLSVMILKLF